MTSIASTGAMKSMKHILLFNVFGLFIFSGCAVLHKTQISEIDNRTATTPFEIKVSETGVDMQDVVAIQRGLFKNSKEVGDAAAIVGLFQMGPRTGAPVYVENYAVDLYKALHAQCPNGTVTGITSIRETRKYPVISGEIIKIKGYCTNQKSGGA